MKTETQTVRRFGFVDTPKSLPEWKEHKHGNYVTFRDYDDLLFLQKATQRALDNAESKLAALEAENNRLIESFRSNVGACLKIDALEAEVQKLREFRSATAYLILMGVTEGKYWERETIEWAQEQMKNEKRVGAAIVRAAINSNAGEKEAR